MPKLIAPPIPPLSTLDALSLDDPSLLSPCAFVDGAWKQTSEVFSVFNPATEEEIASVCALGEEHVLEAIEAAETAFLSWSQTPPKERAALLRRWFEEIVFHREDLARLLTLEQGKPLSEARSEITYAASFVEFYSEEAKRLHGELIPSPWKHSQIMVTKEPLGVICAITPWNFPSAMVTRKVAPALAAGCSVLLKPALETPLSALALAELSRRAGLPKGVFNVLTGHAEVLGPPLMTSPRVRMLTFTGSTAVGKKLMAQCAPTVKKTSLELGGNAPFIVFDDADLDQALEGLMASKFRNAGQTCVCANRIFVQTAIAPTFISRLKERILALHVGPGLDPKTTLGPLISRKACQKVSEHLEDAVAQGAQILAGGSPLEGCFFAPTLLTHITPSMRLFQEETFGPIAPIFVFKEENEVVSLANDTPFGLAAYVYTQNLQRLWRMTNALKCGIVGVNSGVISTELAPFGGVKESGIGREGSHHGIEEFLSLKYILLGGL